MAISLTVNGNVFEFPENRDSPTWGDEVTDWANAVTQVLAATLAPADIIPSSFNINNNVTVFTNITGLQFSPLQVRGAIVDYTVYRSASSGEVVEAGTLYISYKSISNIWEIAPMGIGSAGITWQINAGQVQYKSSDLIPSGGTHTGIMTFRARALSQS